MLAFCACAQQEPVTSTVTINCVVQIASKGNGGLLAYDAKNGVHFRSPLDRESKECVNTVCTALRRDSCASTGEALVPARRTTVDCVGFNAAPRC